MARVPYVDAEDLPAEHRDLLVSQLQGTPRNVYRALGNNPAVLDGFRTFASALWAESGLSERRRELVIIAVANELSSDYEWHQHVRVALDAGVTPAEARAIASGDLDDLDPVEADLVRYALAVVRGEVDDGIHETVAKRVDAGTIVGVATLAATYLHVARLLDAFDVEIEAGEPFVGWALENA